MSEPHVATEQRVTPLELFFDLVFVFAITQVTTFLSDDPTWRGVGQGLLVLAALWWAWVGYAWLTNTTDPDQAGVRLAIFAAMGAMLVVSLAVPEAFDEHGVMFGIAYAVVRVLQLVLYALAARGDRAMLSAVLRLARGSTIGPALIIAAGFLDGAAQAAVWVVALAIDYGGVAGSGQGWRVSAGHFAERHGLIVIIAIGESIVALGVGVGDLTLDTGVLAAALLGLAVAAALWWAYFDVVAIVAERKLHEAEGDARARQARDSYSYLHLPMVAGIILAAFGMKKTLGDVGDPLKLVPAAGLFGGVALYLLAHVAFRLRNVRTLSVRRLLTAILLLALVPAATQMPALAALAALTALTVGLTAYEAVRYRDARARVRAVRATASPV